MKRIALALAVALLLAACAGTPFRWEDTAKIHDGMTEAEVVGILGNPASRAQSGNVTILTWSYAYAFGGRGAVSYQLLYGRVVGVSTVNQPAGVAHASTPPAAFWGVLFNGAGSPVRVMRVISGSAADISGIRVGDVIRELDGNAVTDGVQVLALIAKKKPGDVLHARIERDGAPIEIDATLRAR